MAAPFQFSQVSESAFAMIPFVEADSGRPVDNSTAEAVGAEIANNQQLVASAFVDVGHPREVLAKRCTAAGLSLEEADGALGQPCLKLGMKCGRNVRWLLLGSDAKIRTILSIPFERFVFLSDYAAICSYEDGIIEANLRSIGTPSIPSSFAFTRLFSPEGTMRPFDPASVRVVLQPPEIGLPRIEISPPSEIFLKLNSSRGLSSLTLKLSGCRLSTHDQAVTILKKASDSVFFQIDLLTNVALTLGRERGRSARTGTALRKVNLATDLQYPKTEFDEAPLSLYWYGRSAVGMPLLQFLAFYQVIEFYFPIYSKAEAQRKLRAILKDPTFRGDRDPDIAKLLSAIQISRTGSFGDERSQLRATVMECIDPMALRNFLESQVDRKAFYLDKASSARYHKVPLANENADLRNDVADRIYDIRCKIVHTKSDSRDGEVELLLPFSAEAQQLLTDVELAQFLSHSVLIAGSVPFRSTG